MDVIDLRISIFCYKFGWSLADVLALTIPQLTMLEATLSRIMAMENGTSSGDPRNSPPESTAVANTMATQMLLQDLKRKTGRQSFTLDELDDPVGTLARYKIQDKTDQSEK